MNFKILYTLTFVQFILDQKKAIKSLASLAIHFRANLVPYDVVLNDFRVPVYVRASTSSPVIGCRQGPATAPGPASHTPLSVSHPGTEPQTGITLQAGYIGYLVTDKALEKDLKVAEIQCLCVK